MKKKILLSIWSDPCMYINLLFLINFFLKKKYEIILICKKIDRKKDFLYFINKNKLIKIIEIKSEGKIGYLYFFKKKISIIRSFKPDILFSFNFISLFFSFFVKKKKINWIYYNFDFNVSSKFNFNNFIEKIIIKKVDSIFLPSSSRVNFYKRIFKVNKNIYSINNTFSKYFKIKKNKKINKYNLFKKKYLVRIGSFYNYHYLEELIFSTNYWCNNYKLVIAGKSYGGYFEKLKKFIKKNKIKNVILIKNVSYELWFSLLKNAFAGFALYEPINVSHRFMGGTSQKLNNYIYANIPSIISKSYDNKKFNEKFKTSLLVSGNYKDIAKKTNFLIKNRIVYKKLKNNNNIAFLKEFNFEKQLNKVLKYII